MGDEPLAIQGQSIADQPMPSLDDESADPPIDIRHLAEMTLADPELQREVLLLFATQSTDILNKLAARSADAEMLAHTLVGSARAVGANRVADAASKLEQAAKASSDIRGALVRLQHEVSQACIAIGELLKTA